MKTRLQSQARAGETVYKGVADGLRKILVEEGSKGKSKSVCGLIPALFKGGIAR